MNSPCIKLCRIDDGKCIGCNRTQDEIREWFYANNERKLEILKRITMKINFVKLHAYAKLPVYSTTEAAGADVHSVQAYTILPGQHQLIKTGLGCDIPRGWEIQVRPRSGLALKNKVTVLNSPGTIDSDYIHELCVILINHNETNFVIQAGDRIAQLVCAPVYQANFGWTDSTKQTDRVGGFGSTGV